MSRVFLIAMTIATALAQKTVLDGVYTSAQAARGEAVFEMNCAKCHEGADVDGPPLTGDPFIDRWREDSLGGLFAFIKTRMPQDAAGKLPENAYLDVLTYLLKANTYPTGAKELTTASLDSTLLVGKDGAKPLPSNTLVQVVGCLSPGANNVWTLTNATEPVRGRSADETTPGELRDSAAKPLGAQTFRLQNLDDFKPDAFKGHKVQARGGLIRQPNNNRINVTSLQSVGSSCAP